MSASLDVAQLAEHNPLAHPAVASVRLFDYSMPPGDHLLELYNTLWKACDPDFPHAPTRVARLMPRGHGKTESVGVVFPTWLVLARPNVRIAVISKTKGLAGERTEKAVEYIDRHASRFGVEIAESGRTQITTEANSSKEPTLSPYGLESQLTGKHFDVILWDDICDWDNQRTETQRRNVRQYFSDYVDNLVDHDSVLPTGAVQAMIGTRKHPQDLYATDILESPQWDVGVYRAIAEEDWTVVETRDWQVRGQDGDLYESIADLPPDVPLAPEGVIPNREVDVLWPELRPAESLLFDIVGGDSSTAVWRRENQQDPHALSGEVFQSEWLVYLDQLPKPRDELRWVAGLDLGLVEDAQKAAEGDSDFTALSLIGADFDNQIAYLDRLVRERGLSVKGIVDWVVRQLPPKDADDAVDKLLVEQNAGRGVGQRLRDETPIPAENVDSSGSKEARIHNLSADFEGGTLRIVGSPDSEPWRSFEQDEWIQFPNGAHDDMLDCTEIGMRAVGFGNVPSANASLEEHGYTPEGEEVGPESREFRESEIGQAVQQLADRNRRGL